MLLSNISRFYSAPGEVWTAKSVCLSAGITPKPRRRTSSNFSACCLWPWLDPCLAALRYVMYFRFSGWRHVFAQWPNKHDSREPRFQANVAPNDKDPKYRYESSRRGEVCYIRLTILILEMFINTWVRRSCWLCWICLLQTSFLLPYYKHFTRAEAPVTPARIYGRYFINLKLFLESYVF